MLEAIHLKRDEVYICNIIKCRPPGNRNPEEDEISACIPFLRRQIRAIKPRLILALGAFAAQTLLETDTAISKLRGPFHAYNGIPLLATYHPAFLLRNPGRKRDAWEDMQKLEEAYEKL
jgi:DNA polymerase